MNAIAPTSAADRSRNELRPQTLDEIVGQEKAKLLMRRAIQSSVERVKPLDHTLLVAASGLGKSTFSHVVANELGVNVFSCEAPVSTDVLAELRPAMLPGDILMIEEIHQQAIMERRGRTGATQPEILYSVMEDRILQTPRGPLPFEQITIIGTTTDEGMLPDAFINRFPLRPRLVDYTHDELCTIVRHNAATLEVNLTEGAVDVFAGAARGVPREINNLVKNARTLGRRGRRVQRGDALEVLDVNGISEDGLTADMQATLRYLLSVPKRTGSGEIVYRASVGSIATAIGKSRDSKAVMLRVEPYLIQKGLLQVAHGGRVLTDAGIERAKELIA